MIGIEEAIERGKLAGAMLYNRKSNCPDALRGMAATPDLDTACRVRLRNGSPRRPPASHPTRLARQDQDAGDWEFPTTGLDSQGH